MQHSLLGQNILNFQRFSILQTIPRLESTGMIPGNTELPPASLSPVLISSQHPIRCVMPAAFERAESCQAVPGQTPGCTSAPVASPAQELNNICYYTKACKILVGFLYVFEDFNVSSRKYLKQLHSLRLRCTICSPWAQISMCYRQRGFHLNTCSSIFSNSYATWGSISPRANNTVHKAR